MLQIKRNMTYDMSYLRKFNAGTQRCLGILGLFILLFGACKKDEIESVKVPLTITDYYPNSGAQGTLVTVEGTGFSNNTDEISATFPE